MKSQIRKKLLEVREQKRNLIIERNIIKKRFTFLVESFGPIENYHALTEQQKSIISSKILVEIHKLHKNNLITEQDFLTDILKSLFKGFGFGAIEGIVVEPLINTILSKLGLGGYFKNFLVSFFSTDPNRIVEAFKSCESLVKLLSEAITEAIFMMIQENIGAEGVGYDVIRNALGKTIKETSFAKNIEDGFSDKICQVFDQIYDKAKDVVDKAKQAKPAEK